MQNQALTTALQRDRGLGQLYVDHPEFRAHYDEFRPGLADFLQPAMAYYADHVLASRVD